MTRLWDGERAEVDSGADERKVISLSWCTNRGLLSESFSRKREGSEPML